MNKEEWMKKRWTKEDWRDIFIGFIVGAVVTMILK